MRLEPVLWNRRGHSNEKAAHCNEKSPPLVETRESPHKAMNTCNPMDCSPPDSSLHGILQARILDWVVIPFCRIFPSHVSCISCIGGRILYHAATREAQ